LTRKRYGLQMMNSDDSDDVHCCVEAQLHEN
jgi:hypothetical protein